ncbi:MAG TPA: ACP S-malonyltransferase [Acidimicrobiia bacterium]|nr:ACP S-malonyltransferase [Acidimicrobiia bacterium]
MGIAVLFPGQGTQSPGMGAPWRDQPAWSVIERAEAAFGEPLAELVLDAPAERLARTREAQLAVLLTSLVAWEAIRDRVPEAVAFAGHSLGQVTALIASGALSLEDGVRFAARRAELTQAAADANPGRMVALLGATVEQAVAACDAAPDGCWVANDNAPGQVVLAGTPDGVEAASARAKDLGVKRVTPLNVGGAFHTPLMAGASEALGGELETVAFTAGGAPVVSNLDALPHADGAAWRARSAEHVSVPVRWRESVQAMVASGATTFLEVGHGTMLAGLAKRTVPDVPVRGVATPDDAAALTLVLEEAR